MDQLILQWYCGHCNSLNELLNDAYCCHCQRRRDGYAFVCQLDQVDLLEQSNDLEIEVRATDPTSKDFLQDPTPSLTSIDADKPKHSGSFQAYSIGPDSQFEDSLFSSNNPGGLDWVPSEQICFSEAKGLLTFSLTTGEPATAPRKRAYSPVSKAKVALVRKHGACSSCRRSKHACNHFLEDRAVVQGANQISASKPRLEGFRKLSTQLADSGMAKVVTARNWRETSSVIPRSPSIRTNTRRRTRVAGISVPPQTKERPLFLPVPPKLTFITETDSKSASSCRPKSKKKPASQCYSTAPAHSTDNVRTYYVENAGTNLYHKSEITSTFAAGTNQVSKPLTPKANDPRLRSDLSTKPSGTRHPSMAAMLDDKPSHTSPTVQMLDTSFIHTIDVLEEFTWIDEMYEEEIDHSDMLSPFSSNTSLSSDVHLRSDWDSSTDITGASGGTTPCTDDDGPCLVPSWDLMKVSKYLTGKNGLQIFNESA